MSENVMMSRPNKELEIQIKNNIQMKQSQCTEPLNVSGRWFVRRLMKNTKLTKLFHDQRMYYVHISKEVEPGGAGAA